MRWLDYTAREINGQLGRKATFWQSEPFDHLVRSAEQFEYFERVYRPERREGEARRDGLLVLETLLTRIVVRRSASPFTLSERRATMTIHDAERRATLELDRPQVEPCIDL